MSGISIRIEAGANYESSKAYATGSLQHLITDAERATFGIRDADLKRKIGAYMGREPNDAFVGDHHNWGNLYHKYGWDQVQTVLIPRKAKILSIDSVPTILSRSEFKNDSGKSTKFDAKLSQKVSNTVANSWSQSHSLSFNQEINYDVKFLGTGVGGKTSFGFEAQWGKTYTKSETTTFEQGIGLSRDLEPGEEVVAELSANLGKMKVRITYEAYLTGQTAVNYYPRFEGHHFYGLYISSVLGSSNSVTITEDIEIGVYTQAKASIKDAAGSTLCSERACRH